MHYSISSNTRTGGALLLVMGFILLASWLMLQFMARVRAEMNLSTDRHQSTYARSAAFQTLDMVIAVLAEIKLLDGQLYSPVQGWGDVLGYAGLTGGDDVDGIDPQRWPVTHYPGVQGGEAADFRMPPGLDIAVEIQDESGLLPLNHTSDARWKTFFEAMNVSPADINILTDSLLDWIDKDNQPRLNGAESDTYLLSNLPYEAANRSIYDLQELRLIQGFDRLFFDTFGVPNELFRSFAENVSTWSAGPVNLNTAPTLVLTALAKDLNFDQQRVEDYRGGSDRQSVANAGRILRPDLTATDIPLDNSGKPLDFSAPSRFLSVRIHVGTGGSRFGLTARLDTAVADDAGVYPIRIADLQVWGGNS